MGERHKYKVQVELSKDKFKDYLVYELNILKLARLKKVHRQQEKNL